MKIIKMESLENEKKNEENNKMRRSSWVRIFFFCWGNHHEWNEMLGVRKEYHGVFIYATCGLG